MSQHNVTCPYSQKPHVRQIKQPGNHIQDTIGENEFDEKHEIVSYDHDNNDVYGGCDWYGPNDSLDNHIKNECQYKPIKCEFEDCKSNKNSNCQICQATKLIHENNSNVHHLNLLNQRVTSMPHVSNQYTDNKIQELRQIMQFQLDEFKAEQKKSNQKFIHFLIFINSLIFISMCIICAQINSIKPSLVVDVNNITEVTHYTTENEMDQIENLSTQIDLINQNDDDYLLNNNVSNLNDIPYKDPLPENATATVDALIGEILILQLKASLFKNGKVIIEMDYLDVNWSMKIEGKFKFGYLTEGVDKTHEDVQKLHNTFRSYDLSSASNDLILMNANVTFMHYDPDWEVPFTDVIGWYQYDYMSLSEQLIAVPVYTFQNFWALDIILKESDMDAYLQLEIQSDIFQICKEMQINTHSI
eukprot:526682_1